MEAETRKHIFQNQMDDMYLVRGGRKQIAEFESRKMTCESLSSFGPALHTGVHIMPHVCVTYFHHYIYKLV